MKRSLFIVCAAFGIAIGIVSLSVHLYAHSEEKADLVIFSYDRPLQLYALLESVHKYITGLGETHVIYRASNDAYAQAYDQVRTTFSSAQFARQGDNPAADFKPLTLKATFDSPNNYILFAVDDIVVKDFVSLGECINALEKMNAYGFFLRLGTNLSECYSLQCKQPVPPLKEVAPGIFAWKFSEGRCDWAYPHTVDITLYRKKDISEDLRSLFYRSPNYLEGTWHSRSGRIMHRFGLCFVHSKIVNIPLNKVQTDNDNIHMNLLSPLELRQLFEQGMKMDISLLYKIDNKGAHMAYKPTFILR